MPELAEIWNDLLPKLREAVTGVGVWTALNASKPVAFEDGVLVIGVPHEDAELSGHLKVVTTKRILETFASRELGKSITVRIIDGIGQADWEAQKRRDGESRRLQELNMNKMRAEMTARSSWESIYDQLGRQFAAIVNKSLPQNRARFYAGAVEMVAEVRRGQETWDELGERNFARCLERLAQYAEIPSAIVAGDVLRRAGEL
ncbi:MAG TPA: hypothetical protein VKT78_13455 [Fimbriimonadaceae bacterium]|nr:hypothetical protein [Fimbriimonadaceae bacterium]